MSERTPTYLTSSLEDGVLTLTITQKQIEGEEIAQALKQELLAAVADARATRVVLDMSRTRYVSSIAFWPLLALNRQLKEQGGKLVLCGLTGAVLDVFTTTKMVIGSGPIDAPFAMAADVPTAVSTLRQP